MRWSWALVVGLLAVPAVFAQPLPLFDTHIHYSQPAWDVYSPEAALAILNRAGVRRALVSSTPDDGTLKLYEKAPRLVVPFLRPYRTRDDMGTWTQDPTVLPYLEGRLARGIYKGIGEFHLSAGEAGSPVVRGTVALAARHNLFLHAHADETAVRSCSALILASTSSGLTPGCPRARRPWDDCSTAIPPSGSSSPSVLTWRRTVGSILRGEICSSVIPTV